MTKLWRGPRKAVSDGDAVLFGVPVVGRRLAGDASSGRAKRQGGATVTPGRSRCSIFITAPRRQRTCDAFSSRGRLLRTLDGRREVRAAAPERSLENKQPLVESVDVGFFDPSNGQIRKTHQVLVQVGRKNGTTRASTT